MNLENILSWQWIVIVGSSLVLLFISPMAKSIGAFFSATKEGNKKPGLWLLTSSLVISWIFAKSITNAANLGMTYGIVGGVAYATYYLSFLFAGLLIYDLRVKGRYESIHHFLMSKYGRSAVLLFSILIAFRLLNEVWSNTMVIGSYFGAIGSQQYYLAISVFTLLTLAYSLKGGLSSSLMTDAIQMILFGLLLGIILIIIVPASDGINSFVASGTWTLEGGVDLLLVALIQVFSYPFHDPVMTDRGFITVPATMRKAFIVAVPIGFVAIILFSFVGVYAAQQGFQGQAAVQVAKMLGAVMMLVINFIMITSASSTLDSAFSSFSKLAVIDLSLIPKTITNGRLVMVLFTLVGTIPIFFSPAILSATTISGTMVIGLAPIFLFWRSSVSKNTFLLTVVTGILFGVWYATGLFPDQMVLVESNYGPLLSVNLFGTICCLIVFLLCRKSKA